MKKENRLIVLLCLIVIFLIAGTLSLLSFSKLRRELASCWLKVTNYQQQTKSSAGKSNKPKGIMILIEYEDTKGLVNMVNELYKRDIHALLHVGPDFVENNCETIKKLTNYNVSLVGGCGDELWNLTYEEQLKVITDTKERIEACTGQPLEFITSRYWGWDENTVKIADKLGIKNIFARGLVENGAAIFQPEGYDVKILSVSNIKAVPFKYGSVCDYSYWVRGGTPSDMLAELDDAIANNDKISPVSHTNIGGFKEDWFKMWQDFFDSGKVDWVSWEEFSSTVDFKMPLNRIPRNKNVPYTPEMRESRDKLYQQGKNVDNPCAIEDLPPVGNTNLNPQTKSSESQGKILMFHNGKGPMCLEAMDFLKSIDYPNEQVLTDDPDFFKRLTAEKEKFTQSEGVSSSFGYYPIIFIKNRAFSGFNQEIKNQILKEIGQSPQSD